MTINPQGMTVIEWTDAMAFLLNGSPPTQKLLDPTDWKTWGRSLLQTLPDGPNVDEFEDWREWAMRLNSTEEFGG
jgi:hypothetical protein